MIFFSGDLHLGHANIIRFCKRPQLQPGDLDEKGNWKIDRGIISSRTREMDEMLIANNNEIVSENDELYIVGDVGFNPGYTAKCLARMNGKKHLIKGNHDKIRPILKEQFEWIKDYHELYVQDKMRGGQKQMIVLMHYAMRVWNKAHWGSFMLYGHSHNGLEEEPDQLSFDVGVDAVAYRFSKDKDNLGPKQYRPISYNEVRKVMMKKDFTDIKGKKLYETN